MPENNSQESPEEIAIKSLSKHSSSDVMIINGPLDYELESLALEQLKDRRLVEKRPEQLIFLLTTPGGDPDAAYRIGRAIQRTYRKSSAIVGGWCKSAGTLLTISANSLILSDEAELGPLDMQLAKRDELNESDSGLVIDEALDNLERYVSGFFDSFMKQIKAQSKGLVTLKTASEISSTIVKGLFEPIYRQIDPQKIGEIARSMAVGKGYGQRLNIRPKNLKPRALDSLLKGYPSHGFVIDREEAEVLFYSVRKPDAIEQDFLVKLGRLAKDPCREPKVMLYAAEEEDHDQHRVPASTPSSQPAVKQPRRRASSSK
jgi:hypothetical protein